MIAVGLRTCMDESNKTARALLIRSLRAALRGETYSPPPDCPWDRLLPLARAQQVENLLWYALRGVEGIPQDAAAQLELAHRKALFFSAQVDIWSARIEESMSRAGASCVPLRGVQLRRQYPSPDMRPMADIDYLARTADYPAIQKVMEAQGGRHVHTDGGHFTFVVPPGLHIEFHPNLVYVMSMLGTQVNPGWQYVRDGRLTAEGEYLNHICHLASDLTRGGAGVRTVMDNWICRRSPAGQPDWAAVERELDAFGLLKFARNVEQLADWWFGEGGGSETLHDLGGYIIDSGAHGTVRQAVLAEAACRKSGMAALFLHKAIYPMQEMKGRYPWLERWPFLFPAACLARWARAIRLHRGQIRDWVRHGRGADTEAVSEFRERLERFGLSISNDCAAGGREK